MRENALCALMASGGCAAMTWLGLYGFAWNDYEVEALPAYNALVHAHVLQFLRLAPAYGGSLIERAPFALLPGLWGGGELAVYRAVALPCLLIAAALGIGLVARMRTHGHSALARAIALGLCVANPITLIALELGHPEELLGASLCIAAVLLACQPPATRMRALSAGAMLGLAIANKEWALLAAGPVLLALPPRLRRRCMLATAFTATVVLAPLLIASSGFLASTRGAAAPSTNIFQPWQLWWFFGHHGALVHGGFGTPKPGYRIAPAWSEVISHPLIIALAAGAPLLLRLRSRRLIRGDALLALALLLLARCLLDTWDSAPYTIPFLFALLAWEVHEPSPRPPLLALCSTVLVWLCFQWLPEHQASADAQAAFFLAWSLPLAAWLSTRLGLAPARHVPAEPSRAQEMTVSSLERLVSTS